ncbi:MAG: hypothetical protein HRU09_17645 [Oligoflexales bacterium]|nr:hypothetical protein [Oligoflexales bacterium]
MNSSPPNGTSNSNGVEAFSINPSLGKSHRLSKPVFTTEKTLNAQSIFLDPSEAVPTCPIDSDSCYLPKQDKPNSKKKPLKIVSLKALKLPITKELSPSVGIPVLARASLATYDTEHTFENESYHLCNHSDFDGFRAATYCNPFEKVAIIAFRGTQNSKDAAFDLAMFYGQEQVLGPFAKLYSGLGYTQDSLLEALTAFGDRVVEGTNKEFGKKVKKAHQHYLEELNHKWQSYRNHNLSPHGIAEKVLNERVGYVTNYTKEQIKHFKSLGYKIFITGHSLGGLYAQLASMMFALPGATFNAPGISDVLYYCKNFKPQVLHTKDFVNYRHNDDLVSLFRLNDHFGKVIAHESHRKDPYTAHNMELLSKFLDSINFDEQGEHCYQDLMEFINEEDGVLKACSLEYD